MEARGQEIIRHEEEGRMCRKKTTKCEKYSSNIRSLTGGTNSGLNTIKERISKSEES